MSFVSLELLTNSTSEAQNLMRDTSFPTIIAGLSSDRLYLFCSESTTFFLFSGASLLGGFQPGKINVSDDVCEQPGS